MDPEEPRFQSVHPQVGQDRLKSSPHYLGSPAFRYEEGMYIRHALDPLMRYDFFQGDGHILHTEVQVLSSLIFASSGVSNTKRTPKVHMAVFLTRRVRHLNFN
jgi:hypothetical protein